MAEKIASKFGFFLLGLGIGSVVGILIAPNSGEAAREYLALKARKVNEYAQREARELRERAEALVERGKEVVRQTKEQIAAAVDVGRETYEREKLKAKGA